MTETKLDIQRPMDICDYNIPWVSEGRNKGQELRDPGKWLLFYPKSKMNDAWEQAVNLYRGGKLIGVNSMKCSTNAENDRSSDERQGVIILYCSDSGNESEIMLIGRNVLGRFGYREKRMIFYKTDVQTKIGTSAMGEQRNYTYKLLTVGEPSSIGRCLI